MNRDGKARRGGSKVGCRWAARGLATAALLTLLGGTTGCENAGQGFLSGAALGSLAGMGLGSLSGDMGKGAAAGAIVGGLMGGFVGDQNYRSGRSWGGSWGGYHGGYCD